MNLTMDQQNGYGGRQNRYEQLGNTNDYYGGQAQQGYGQNPRYQQNYGQGNNTTGGSNFEMAPVGPPAARNNGEMNVGEMLDKVTDINKKIVGINTQIDNIEYKIAQYLSTTHQTAEADEAIENEFAKIMSGHKKVVQDFRQLKMEFKREHSQFKQGETNLRNTTLRFQRCRRDYMEKTKGQRMRQLQLVYPNVDERQLDEMAEHGVSENMMEMAMKDRHRNAAAEGALSNVKNRHEQIAQIERQVQEVAQLMEQLNAVVEEQEVFVHKAEENAVETTENLDKGNDEILVATNSARGARKKKWICLGICVAIIIVIVIIVLIYIFVIKGTTGNAGTKSSKRELEDVASTVVSNVISHANRLESRQPIDEELAAQMARISRLRFHFPQMPTN